MSDTDIAAQLGELRGIVAGIPDQIARVEKASTERGGKFSDALAEIRKAQQAHVLGDATRDARLADHEKRLADAEVVTKSVNGWRARWAGATIVLGTIGTVVLASVAAFKDKILAMIGS